MKSAKLTSILSYFQAAFYIVAGLLYMPYLINTLGVSDYGIYALATSLIGYFSLDFGIGAAQTRLVARYVAEGREYKIRDMLGITSKIFLVIDCFIFIICSVVYFFADDIFTNLSSRETIRFQNVFIITTIFVLVNFPLLPGKGLFLAFGRAFEFTLIELLYKLINIISIVTALYFGGGLYWVVVANVGTNIIAQIYRIYFIFHKEKLRINIRAKDKEIVTFITSFSSWATVAMVADKFFFGAIPFLLAAFAGTKEVAFFAIVISLEGYILSISRSLNGIFLPRVMKMIVNDEDNSNKTKMMIRVGRVQLYIVGLIVVGLISQGREFICHWLGPGFDKSYYCMVLVLLPCLFHLTKTIAEELILATNKVKYRALAYSIGSSISVCCIILFAPKIGALAAGLGCFLSFVVAHNLIMDVIYQKKMGLNIVYFLKQCHLKILPSFVICGIIGFLMQQYVSTPSILLFFVKMIIWGIISLIVLWFFAFNNDEKLMVKQLLRIEK